MSNTNIKQYSLAYLVRVFTQLENPFELYKCESVNVADGTWSGKKMEIGSDLYTYSFSETLTEDLPIQYYTPEINNIYSKTTQIKVVQINEHQDTHELGFETSPEYQDLFFQKDNTNEFKYYLCKDVIYEVPLLILYNESSFGITADNQTSQVIDFNHDCFGFQLDASYNQYKYFNHNYIDGTTDQNTYIISIINVYSDSGEIVKNKYKLQLYIYGKEFYTEQFQTNATDFRQQVYDYITNANSSLTFTNEKYSNIYIKPIFSINQDYFIYESTMEDVVSSKRIKLNNIPSTLSEKILDKIKNNNYNITMLNNKISIDSINSIDSIIVSFDNYNYSKQWIYILKDTTNNLYITILNRYAQTFNIDSIYQYAVSTFQDVLYYLDSYQRTQEDPSFDSKWLPSYSYCIFNLAKNNYALPRSIYMVTDISYKLITMVKHYIKMKILLPTVQNLG